MTRLWPKEDFWKFEFRKQFWKSEMGPGGNFPAKAHVDRGVDRAVDTPGPQVDRAVDLGVDWAQKHNAVFWWPGAPGCSLGLV